MRAPSSFLVYFQRGPFSHSADYTSGVVGTTSQCNALASLMSVRLSSQRDVGESLSSPRTLAREFKGSLQPIDASLKLHNLCLGWASQARNLLHLSSQNGETFIELWTADDSFRKPLSKGVNTIARIAVPLIKACWGQRA
ncbi:hypothetical protein N7G274_007807 [Stereocaulon virgatum]|uniref:Uncharacterized protein n=1 Tax=Stereocaulon virgatum TaxID=373712 RepID=A0ABR4A272_9LECA